MSTVNIRNIFIKGFGSIVRPFSYDFSTPGLNLILGENGVGKTQIFNALSWCLFGETLKAKSSIEPWEHVRGDRYHGTKVIVWFDVDGKRYKVIRCKEYTERVFDGRGKNRLILFENKVPLPIKKKKDVQAKINQVLGYSFVLFKNSVLFGQELKRLMEEEGPARKQVLEEAFEVSYISYAKKRAEEELGKLDHVLMEKQADLKVAQAELEFNKESLRNARELRVNFETQKQEELSGVQREIDYLEGTIETKRNILASAEFKNLEKLFRRKEEIEALIDNNIVQREFKQQTIVWDLSARNDNYDADLEKTKAMLVEIKPICDHCGQEVPKEKRAEHKRVLREVYGEILNKKKENLKKLNQEIEVHGGLKEKVASQEKLRNKLSRISLKIRKLEKEKSTLDDTQRQIGILESKLEGKKTEYQKISERTLKLNIAKLKSRTQSLIGLADKKTQELAQVEKEAKLLKWLIKDPLSNSGLKAFIFDTMIEKINHRLKFYSKYTGFEPQLYVDLESANKDIGISITRNGRLVLYWDLSKGQKQLSNVALIFALNDVITVNKPINIMLIDEVFESLSKNNVEVVGTIISDKSKGKSIHLITHHSSFSPQHCRKITLKLNDDNQTVINTAA